VAIGRRLAEAKAKSRGLKGGEECPGCLDRYGVWEVCSVFKDGLGGRGSDGKKGRMIEEKWHCNLHGQRLRMRASRV
jgi:hypothetical protein